MLISSGGKKMGIKFVDSIYKIEKDEKVVLADLDSGRWIRISKVVYKAIEYIIKKELYEKEPWDFIIYEEDRAFIKKIITDMMNIGLVKEKDDFNMRERIILVELTNRCNLNCKHCCVSASYEGEELSNEQLKNLFDIVLKLNPTQLFLTGGEPLIREDFIDIINYIRKRYHKRISLLTNGTLITDKNIDFIIENIDKIEISLDGVDEETCSKIRGKDVFKRIIDIVLKLKEKGFNNISLSITLGDNDYEISRKFLDLNTRLNTEPILRKFAPVGRGKEIKDKFLNISESSNNIEAIFSQENLKSKYTKKIVACNCKAGKEVLYIDYKADVYPCHYLIDNKFKLGNILNINHARKENIINSIKKYYPQNYRECQDCEVNIFCWPCPGELFRMIDDREYFLASCEKIKPILIERVWG